MPYSICRARSGDWSAPADSRRRTHDERRHQVFEHRARPGDERRAVCRPASPRGRAETSGAPARRSSRSRRSSRDAPRRRAGRSSCHPACRRPRGSRSRAARRSGSSRKPNCIAVGHCTRGGLDAGQPLSQSRPAASGSTADPVASLRSTAPAASAQNSISPPHLIAELTGERPRNVGERCGQRSLSRAARAAIPASFRRSASSAAASASSACSSCAAVIGVRSAVRRGAPRGLRVRVAEHLRSPPQDRTSCRGERDPFATRIGQRNEMAGKIAAVDRGDVARLERAQIECVVPVVEVTAILLQAAHRC